jgi:hypothetical protein
MAGIDHRALLYQLDKLLVSLITGRKILTDE